MNNLKEVLDKIKINNMIKKTDGPTFILLKTDCHKESPIMDWIKNNNATSFLKCHHTCAWAGRTVYTNIWL